MKRSETIGALAAALAKAQGAMLGAPKDATNPHYKSRYADLSSIIGAIKSAMAANGLSYAQFVLSSEGADAAGIETVIMHESGEWLMGDPAYVPLAKHDAQGFGSAITYLRRYSLAAAVGVAPEDDDANAASRPPAQSAPEPSPEDVEKRAALINSYVENMRACSSREALRELSLKAIGICVEWGDKAGEAKLRAEYKALRDKLRDVGQPEEKAAA